MPEVRRLSISIRGSERGVVSRDSNKLVSSPATGLPNRIATAARRRGYAVVAVAIAVKPTSGSPHYARR